MATLLALIDVLILIAAGILHVYWASGGSWGLKYAMPLDSEPAENEEMYIDERFGRPGKLLTRFIGLLCFILTILLLARVELISLPLAHQWTVLLLWLAAGLFFLRAVGDFKRVGLFRKDRRTLFAQWDRRLFTPLFLFLALSIAAINFLARQL